MKHVRISIVSAVALSAFIISCSKEELTNSVPKPKKAPDEAVAEPVLPSQSFDYVGTSQVDNSMATLGRVLFYDKNLSVNNAVSCGSCHKQANAFADDMQFSIGFDGKRLKRNSPSIQGLVGFKGQRPSAFSQLGLPLFWDSRQFNLMNMMLDPIVNKNEMNMPSVDALVEKLSGLPYYERLFTDAFGNEVISRDRIALALEAFVQCLNTPSGKTGPFSPGDSSLAPNATLEEQGRFFFEHKYNCAECHNPGPDGGYNSAPSSSMFNIGLDAEYTDQGRGAFTGNSFEDGMFKAPTLRNIAVTAPYMHDGRFTTLEEVLEHYSKNIKPHRNLSEKLKDGEQAKKMNLSAHEKTAIIAFLKSLKDETFLTSPMYSDPFVN
jgi:cytochrome c peroxidase